MEKRKWNLKALAFLEIGVFEIVFVGIVLFLLFGTLNYFNILSVSDAFPKYLSWLPRQTTQTKNISLNQQNIVFSPTPVISLEKNAKDTLANFLPKILNASLIPSKSDMIVTQDKITKDSFTISWEKKEGTISAVFILPANPEEISSLNIQLPTTQASSPSIQSAEATTSSLFVIQPNGKWGCKPLYDRTYCENFWEENDGIRRGISMYGPFTILNGTAGSIVSFCQHGKSAATIYSWKSCTAEFADTGI
ncbi:MAG: hypothetical protein HYW62_01465 [Candidatus Levybacteria bacterium]|nr:hypothetical protein [Candidatus Levybacteria bacterium]